MTATTTKRPGTKGSGAKGSGAKGSGAKITHPGRDYLVLRLIIFLLIGIGLLMAFSTSMATSEAAKDSTVWSQAIRQAVMVIVGLGFFWVALRTPPRYVRNLTFLFVLVSGVLLVLVLTPLGFGREDVGSQSWIGVGPISVQPSEIARMAIALCGASMLANREFNPGALRTLDQWLKDPFVGYIGVSGLFFLLIILQGDVGMGLSFALVVLFTLYFAGMHKGFFLFALGVGVLAGFVIFTAGGYRSNRFTTYFAALIGHIEDTQGNGFQSYQGFLSLADGGLFGVGLGQSRAKWFYLPEAKNDFVFAIVGEELGLWGAAAVVILFGALGYFGIRTALNAQNQFQSLAAATITAAVVSQAFVNMAYVVGLVPVTGIQLPMISSGGSATIITIAAMGLLCNIARHEPQQVSAMHNYGRPLFDRVLRLPEPKPVALDRAPAQKPTPEQEPLAVPESTPRATGAPARGAAPARAKGRRGSSRRARREMYQRSRFGQPVTANRRRKRDTPPEGRGRGTRS